MQRSRNVREYIISFIFDIKTKATHTHTKNPRNPSKETPLNFPIPVQMIKALYRKKKWIDKQREIVLYDINASN